MTRVMLETPKFNHTDVAGGSVLVGWFLNKLTRDMQQYTRRGSI